MGEPWQYGLSMLECNKYMLKNQIACDVTFQLLGDGGKKRTLGAHRYILLCRSPVLGAMVGGDWQQRESKMIEVDDIEYEVFGEFLRYVYYERCRVTTANVLPLAYSANKYMIKPLEDLCMDYFGLHITIDNSCMLLGQSIEYGADECVEKCLSIIGNNLAKIIGSEEFLTLGPIALHRIARHHIANCNETVLFKACIKWANTRLLKRNLVASDKTVREELGPILFEIRFPLFTSAEFSESYCGKSGLLKHDEKLDIYQHICSDGHTTSKLFKYMPRIRPSGAARRPSCPHCSRMQDAGRPLLNSRTVADDWGLKFQCQYCQRVSTVRKE